MFTFFKLHPVFSHTSHALCAETAKEPGRDLIFRKSLCVMQRAYQHRGGEIKGLKAALRSRDQQLQTVERKLRQLRDVANHDTQEVAEQFGKLKSEGRIHFSRCGSAHRCATFWVLKQILRILHV